jgi:hypothetical protein
MQYNSILSAIPSKWKQLLRSEGPYEFIQNYNSGYEPIIKLNNSLKLVNKLSNKEIYLYLLKNDYSNVPSCIEKWEDLFPFLHNINWQKIFRLPLEITHEPYLQSFQFKILHRKINCNYQLYVWKVKDSPACSFCQESDTIEHHLFICPKSRKFWDDLCYWLYNKLGIHVRFALCEIIFGFFNKENLEHYKLFNLMIILGKTHLNHKRTNNVEPNLKEYLFTFKNKITLLIAIHQGIHDNIPVLNLFKNIAELIN